MGEQSRLSTWPDVNVLKQETRKPPRETCEGSFVSDAPADYGVWPTSDAQVGTSPPVRSELTLSRPPFLWPLRRTGARRRLLDPK
jgi:hypothetical protein